MKLLAIFSFGCLFASAGLHAQDGRAAAFDSTKEIKVILLGTGNPQPWMHRFGPSILVKAGRQTLLFDAGRGALQRLWQLDIPYAAVDALFLTHLHSDHIVGLPDLWLTGWLVSRRTEPLPVFGPEGTAALVKNLREAFRFDIDMRIADDKAPPKGSELNAKEIREDTIYERDGLRVIAFEVDHQPIVPAFGYKITFNGRSVVLSGDTRSSTNLVNRAKGADLLIHEVVLAPENLPESDPKYPVVSHHTTPEEAALIFNEVGPKLAVYAHIVQLYGREEKELARRTAALYKGPLAIGEDLMTIVVGEKVRIQKRESK